MLLAVAGLTKISLYLISSGAELLNCPAVPRASSGSFFAPKRRNTMTRITIMSGPAKFRILAIIVFIAMSQLNGMCPSLIHTNSAELYSGKVIF